MIKNNFLGCILIMVFSIPALASDVNPGYTLVNLRKPEWQWNSVTALAWLDDILVVAEFGGVTSAESLATSDGAIHLISGALTASGS